MWDSTCQTANERYPSRGVMRPSFAADVTLFRTEGAGKTGRRLAPMVRVQQKSTRQNHRFSQIRPAFPAQWFYGLYVISPVTGLCCHRRFASSAKLSASLGAPEPHDFAVRDMSVRLDNTPRPSHPAPNVRDDRETPLCGCGTRGARSDLPDGATGNVHDGQFAHSGNARLSRPSSRTIEGVAVVPAFAPRHSHISKGNLVCRPCERRDPYRVISVVGKKAVPPLVPQIQACGYGSLRSQGRQRVCGPNGSISRPMSAAPGFRSALPCGRCVHTLVRSQGRRRRVRVQPWRAAPE